MELNLSQIVADAVEWEFAIIDGGRRFPTRAPTVGDMVALERLSEDARKLSPLVERIKSLFPAERRPDVEGWSQEQLEAFLEGLGRALGEYAKKKAARRGRNTGEAPVPLNRFPPASSLPGSAGSGT